MLSLEIKQVSKCLTPQYVNGKTLWASSGYTLYKSRNGGENWEALSSIPLPALTRLACQVPPIARLFRLGIHNVLVLRSGGLLAITSGLIHCSIDGGRAFFPVERIRQGRRPLHRGICEDKQGNVYYGEYFLNSRRESVRLYKSTDGGKTFQAVYTFPPRSIRHIHFVQYDFYEDKLWIGTGDRDSECFIAYSKDGGHTFHKIGHGNQCWRAVSVIFTEKCLYWGSDAGLDAPDSQNFIYRWERKTKSLEAIQQLHGPAYYSSILPNGVLVMASGVERGKNELDSCAHLWASSDGENWVDMLQWEKDHWPVIVSHGMIRFPHGQSDIQNEFYFFPIGLKKRKGLYSGRVRSEHDATYCDKQ